MGFHAATIKEDGSLVGGWATIWEVDNKGKYSSVRISTSKKKEDGNYENDFQDNFLPLVGKAHTKAQSLSWPGVIQIRNCDVTKYWSKKTEKEYINFVIYDFDYIRPINVGSDAKKPSSMGFMDMPDGDEDAMPF